MDDLITKYDAMEAISKIEYADLKNKLIAPEQAIKAIGALDPLHGPSLLNELRPKGTWVEYSVVSCGSILRNRDNIVEQKCGRCGRWSQKWANAVNRRYCGHCGAEMVKEEYEA